SPFCSPQGAAQGADKPDEEEPCAGEDQLDRMQGVVVIDHVVENFSRRRVTCRRLGLNEEGDDDQDYEKDSRRRPVARIAIVHLISFRITGSVRSTNPLRWTSHGQGQLPTLDLQLGKKALEIEWLGDHRDFLAAPGARPL